MKIMKRNIFAAGIVIVLTIIYGLSILCKSSNVEKKNINNIRLWKENGEYEGFYFQQLSKEEKELYDIIKTAVLSPKNEIHIAGATKEQIKKCFAFVLYDFPQIFYTNGYHLKEVYGGVGNAYIMTPIYEYNEEHIQELSREIEESAYDLLSETAHNAWKEADLLDNLYESLIVNTNYNKEADNNQNICSVFCTHESVCQGYAKSLQYLLNLLEIDNILVLGETKEGEAHVWNMVLLEGNWYHVDLTFGDGIFDTDRIMGEENEVIHYGYLTMNDEDIAQTHRMKKMFEYPQCTSREANYYVRKNRYLNYAGKRVIKKVFSEWNWENEKRISIKASNPKVYDRLYQYLLKDGAVFDYLPKEVQNVYYLSSGELLTLTFWL